MCRKQQWSVSSAIYCNCIRNKNVPEKHACDQASCLDVISYHCTTRSKHISKYSQNKDKTSDSRGHNKTASLLSVKINSCNFETWICVVSGVLRVTQVYSQIFVNVRENTEVSKISGCFFFSYRAARAPWSDPITVIWRRISRWPDLDYSKIVSSYKTIAVAPW